MSNYLDALAQRVLIFDGAMGTNVQRYQLTAQDYGGSGYRGLQRIPGAGKTLCDRRNP